MSAAPDRQAMLPPLSDDTRPAVRLGVWVILLGLGGFLGWAALAPLDRAVMGSGVVVVSQQRKTIQHLSGGSIKAIKVAEGSTVTQGQTLVQLDTDKAEAELAGVRHHHVLARAGLERLRAQLAGKESLVFSQELQRRADSSGLQDLLRIQARLSDTRKANLRTEDRQLIARQNQLHVEMENHLNLSRRFGEQLAILERQRDSLTELTREGFYPKLRLMDSEREIAEVRTDRTRADGDAQKAEKGITEARSSLERRRTEQQRELETELLETEREAAEMQAREAALVHQITHSQITAPVAGTVVGLEVHTVSGIVQAGQRLMDIVPSDDPYIVEARFPLASTERLAPGQAVKLHFTTMERASTPIVNGTVWTVAADRLEDARSGTHYLLVRVNIPAEEASRLQRAGLPLRPGLPTEVQVNVGQRTLLSYLLKPIRDSFNKALLE